MKNIKTLLIIGLTLQFCAAKGQTEFLVTVNPTTGIHTVIDTLPGVNWIYQGATTYDKNNHRYIFKGIDFDGIDRLYCIDAITGAILSQAPFALNTGEFQYDNSSNTLLGLYINNGQMFLVAIDINTAAITIKATLPIVGFTDGTTFFDEANHTFVLQSSGSFYAINTITGNITTTSAPTPFNQLQFDNSTGILYGLVQETTLFLAKINVSDGTYTTVSTLPSTGFNSLWNTYDEMNHIYIFGSTNQLYSIDVNTGGFVSNPAFPVGITAPENVIELHFDNSNGILYGLHWGTNPNTSNVITNSSFDNQHFNVFPNPISENAIVSFNQSYKEINISIYNSFGQLVISKNGYNSKSISILNENLPDGIYLISVVCDKKHVGTKKILLTKAR